MRLLSSACEHVSVFDVRDAAGRGGDRSECVLCMTLMAMMSPHFADISLGEPAAKSTEKICKSDTAKRGVTHISRQHRDAANKSLDGHEQGVMCVEDDAITANHLEVCCSLERVIYGVCYCSARQETAMVVQGRPCNRPRPLGLSQEEGGQREVEGAGQLAGGG